jgi:hypothetical protein
MLRKGPVPLFFHGVLEYGAAVLLIVAPFLFAFDSGSAKAASIVLGVFLLVVAATTEAPTGISKSLPLPVHVLIDFALAAVLIAAPFLFGFSDEGSATGFFIALGVVHLLLTIATRFRARDDQD